MFRLLRLAMLILAVGAAIFAGCSQQNSITPTPTHATEPSPTPVPQEPPWQRVVLPGSSRVDLLLADPDTKTVYALENVAEKTVDVWFSRDLGQSWVKMGRVIPRLYQTRQVLPEGTEEGKEKLWIWPTLPGNLPLDSKPRSVEDGDTTFTVEGSRLLLSRYGSTKEIIPPEPLSLSLPQPIAVLEGVATTHLFLAPNGKGEVATQAR